MFIPKIPRAKRNETGAKRIKRQKDKLHKSLSVELLSAEMFGHLINSVSAKRTSVDTLTTEYLALRKAAAIAVVNDDEAEANRLEQEKLNVLAQIQQAKGQDENRHGKMITRVVRLMRAMEYHKEDEQLIALYRAVAPFFPNRPDEIDNFWQSYETATNEKRATFAKERAQKAATL